MVTLRVIIDQLTAPVPGGIGRYGEELTRELIRSAPAGCSVEGIVSAIPDPQYADLWKRLPGLTTLYKSPLERRELSAAWRHGLTLLPGKGIVHGTTLLAPLYRHSRTDGRRNQTVVTVHDVLPWTHPESLTPRSVAWHKAMAARARRYADAVVVPTHTVAAQLDEILGFGERLRVIGGAASSALTPPPDSVPRAIDLALPARYLLTLGTLEPRKGLEPLIQSLALPATRDIPLLVIGSGGDDLESVARAAGLAQGRVRALDHLSDPDLAATLEHATAFVNPSLSEGFGLSVLEAFSLGTPVIHSDAPALVEVASDAGIVVERDDPEGYPVRLAEAIGRVLDDTALAERLGYLGRDRSRAFSWRASAEKVWQLHADL